MPQKSTIFTYHVPFSYLYHIFMSTAATLQALKYENYHD